MTAVAAAAPARVRTKSGRRGMKLASDALGDVREGRLFSPYDVDCVLDYFDGRWPPPRGGYAGSLCARSDRRFRILPSHELCPFSWNECALRLGRIDKKNKGSLAWCPYFCTRNLVGSLC